MIKIRIREVYRYLGYHGQSPSEEVIQRVDQCIKDLHKAADPRFVCRRLEVCRTLENPAELHIGTLTLTSKDLARNLTGCNEVFLFAATLGMGPDRLIRRAEVTSMADAAIYQAASAEMIEAWCSEKNYELKKQVMAEGLFLRPRYSPGYGDCPLEAQKEISEILAMPKTIGVCLTETLLMMPTKSVTAFIGISARSQEEMRKESKACGVTEPVFPSAGCASCGARDCLFRKSLHAPESGGKL